VVEVLEVDRRNPFFDRTMRLRHSILAPVQAFLYQTSLVRRCTYNESAIPRLLHPSSPALYIIGVTNCRRSPGRPLMGADFA